MNTTINGGPVSVFRQKYDNIKSISFKVKDPFSYSQSEFQISHTNFTREIDFWFDAGNNQQGYNWTMVNEYKSSHNPDFLIQTPFISGGTAPVWSQVWASQPVMYVFTSDFLHETSYGVWEAEYYFDTSFSGLQAYNDTFLRADVGQMIFNVTIPKRFTIEDEGLYLLAERDSTTLEESEGVIFLSQVLSSGQTFHLVVRDTSTDIVKTLVGFLNPLVLGIFLGIVVEATLSGDKSGRGHRGRRR